MDNTNNLIKLKEWSQNDKSMLIRCIGALAKCYMGELPKISIEEIEWLKSLDSKFNY